MKIKLVDNSHKQKWNDYINAHPKATYCHLFEWKNIIEKAYKLQSHYLIVEHIEEDIVGVLPLFLIKSKLFDNKLVSLPFDLTSVFLG